MRRVMGLVSPFLAPALMTTTWPTLTKHKTFCKVCNFIRYKIFFSHCISYVQNVHWLMVLLGTRSWLSAHWTFAHTSSHRLQTDMLSVARSVSVGRTTTWLFYTFLSGTMLNWPFSYCYFTNLTTTTQIFFLV